MSAGITANNTSAPLGTEQRFYRDRESTRQHTLSRAAQHSAEAVKECTFRPRITAYHEEKQRRHETDAVAAGLVDEAASERSAAGTAADDKRPRQSIAERLAARAAAADQKKEQLRLALEAAKRGGSTFKPTLAPGTVASRALKKGPNATTGAGGADTSAVSSTAHDRLYTHAERQRRHHLEAAMAREAAEVATAATRFRPETNATSKAIVDELDADLVVEGDDPSRGDVSGVSGCASPNSRFYARMQRAEAVARERRRALQEQRRHEHHFRPYISPVSEATIKIKRSSSSGAGGPVDKREDCETRADALYREGVARRQDARERAVADQRRRDAEACSFAPVVSAASAEIAAKANMAVMRAAGLATANTSAVSAATGSSHPPVPAVVERQQRLMEAHRRHMEELKRVTVEAQDREAGLAKRRRRTRGGPSHASSFASAVPVDDDIDKSFGAGDATSTSAFGDAEDDAAIAAHLAQMESREAMRQRAREELAAQVQREQCPFRPRITPTSRALAETRRVRTASAPRYAAPKSSAGSQKSAGGSRSQSPPEPRSQLPPPPHDASYSGPGGSGPSATAESNKVEDDGQPKRKLTREEFAGFLAKQERHVRSHEAKVANAKTEVARRALAECTFQPHVNPSPTEPVYAVDGSVRRQPADTASPLSPVAVDHDDVGFHNNHPPPPGLSAHLRRQQQARQLREDRAAMDARISAGKNPHAATAAAATDRDETVLYLDDSTGSHNDVSGGGRGRRPQSADARLGGRPQRSAAAPNAGDAAALRAAAEAPCVVPFSFDDHRVDPGTGDVHTTRELQNRDEKRRKFVGGAAYDRVSLAAAKSGGGGGGVTSRTRSASADHGVSMSSHHHHHHHHHDRSYGATSLSQHAYEESGHVVVRRSRSAVERAIKKFVGKDAVVRGGFLR